MVGLEVFGGLEEGELVLIKKKSRRICELKELKNENIEL